MTQDGPETMSYCDERDVGGVGLLVGSMHTAAQGFSVDAASSHLFDGGL